MKNVLVMVMCGPLTDPFYGQLENTIRETWANLTPELVFYAYVQGDNKSGYDAVTRTLWIPGNEDMLAIGLDKTLNAFYWVAANTNFDYVFRTNLGSYVNYLNLLDWVKDKPAAGYYAGWSGGPATYASGSGYFCSRDLVELVSANWHKITRQVDDVSIGRFLQSNGIRTAPAMRCDIQNGVRILRQGSEIEPVEFNRPIYHYRLRSIDRSIDVAMMKKLYADKA